MNTLDTNTGDSKTRPALARLNKEKGNGPTSATAERKVPVDFLGHEVKRSISIVEARVQAGPSDIVYIRGQGSGLRWDVGLPMAWVGRGKWVWCTRGAQPGTEFKVLLNDEMWSEGQNALLRPGEIVRIEPQFPVSVPA